MNKLRSVLNGETSLQLQCAVIISHPANDQMLILCASCVCTYKAVNRVLAGRAKAAACPYRPVKQQLIDTGVDQQGGVPGLSANPRPSRNAADGTAFAHHQALGFG